MKQILLFIAFSVLLSSCGKDDFVPEDQIPDWLLVKIAADEASIANSPKAMANYGAWIRYKYKGEYYYEYDNMLSSLSRNPYSESGEWVETSEDPYLDYWDKKCCEVFVWKAPKYMEF